MDDQAPYETPSVEEIEGNGPIDTSPGSSIVTPGVE
jgi:hypothetical protein